MCGVATQGRGITRDGVYDQWVTAYELHTSSDGSEGSWQRQVCDAVWFRFDVTLTSEPPQLAFHLLDTVMSRLELLDFLCKFQGGLLEGNKDADTAIGHRFEHPIMYAVPSTFFCVVGACIRA